MANEQKPAKQQPLEGEGSYTGTRKYNRHLVEHQKEEDVDKLAEEAGKALDGEEGDELREAEKQGKQGPKAPSQH